MVSILVFILFLILDSQAQHFIGTEDVDQEILNIDNWTIQETVAYMDNKLVTPRQFNGSDCGVNECNY